MSGTRSSSVLAASTTVCSSSVVSMAATCRIDERMSAFDDVRELELRPIWDGINARMVNGERLLLGVVELDPGAVAKEHHHEHEQLGMVIRGTVTFRIGDETRVLGPGETWT